MRIFTFKSKHRYIDWEFDVIPCAEFGPSSCRPTFTLRNEFMYLPKLHVAFSDNNNAAFYYFVGAFIIMFILTVLAYGACGGIIFFTLKMRILKLRDGLLKVTQNRANSQKGFLTPSPVFFPLASGTSYVSYVFFSPKKILVWTSFQTSLDGTHSNAVHAELTVWKCAASQPGQSLFAWNPGTDKEKCEMGHGQVVQLVGQASCTPKCHQLDS